MMTKDDSGVLMLILAIIASAILWVVGYNMGISNMEQAAIRRGLAETTVNAGEFRWKSNHTIAHEYFAKTLAPRWSIGKPNLHIEIPEVPDVIIK